MKFDQKLASDAVSSFLNLRQSSAPAREALYGGVNRLGEAVERTVGMFSSSALEENGAGTSESPSGKVPGGPGADLGHLLKILHATSDGMDVADIASRLQVGLGDVASLLGEAVRIGVVSETRTGESVTYSLSPVGSKALALGIV